MFKNDQRENEIKDEEGRERSIEIIVNGRPKTVYKTELSFDEIVALTNNLPGGPNVIYTITYHKGHGNKPEGSLVAGESVKVKEGMVFNVTATDRS